jgi:hypothetical protein
VVHRVLVTCLGAYGSAAAEFVADHSRLPYNGGAVTQDAVGDSAREQSQLRTPPLSLNYPTSSLIPLTVLIALAERLTF